MPVLAVTADVLPQDLLFATPGSPGVFRPAATGQQRSDQDQNSVVFHQPWDAAAPVSAHVTVRLEQLMRTVLWISLGAVVGANLRYFISQAIARMSPHYPWGTLVVNVSGSFLLGLFMVWTTERVLADPRWRLLIGVGLCGGYTTYSSFAFETFALFERGQWAASAWNLVLTNVLCLAGVLLGAALARIL